MPHVHLGAMESHGSPVLLTFIIVLTALLYLRGWCRLRTTSSRLTAWRAVSFLIGLALIWAAAASPIAALDHQLLTVHMIQHLLLMTVAPPLIWLGAPLIALMNGIPKRMQPTIRGAFEWLATLELGTVVTRPVLCWLAATAVLIGWHIPAAFALGLHSEAWHFVEQASFFGTGLLFWWPLIRPWPNASKSAEWPMLLYLFLATVPCDILSGFLVFCERVVYPIYNSSSHLYNLSALADQQCAGALMWTSVTVIYLVAGTIFAARLLSPGIFDESEPAPSGPSGSEVSQPNSHGLEVA